MPNRGLRFRRFVAFTLDSMQMKELRSLHVFELIEHPNDVSYIVTVEWSEVADVHSLEDILLMTERTLQSVVETDNPFASVIDRKSTRLNSSHANISYAVFCLKKKKKAYMLIY